MDLKEKIKLNKEKMVQLGIEPIHDDSYLCETCFTVGLENPNDGTCFNCGDDNWTNEFKTTNVYQLNTSQFYYKCEKCKYDIFDINLKNFCPCCGSYILNKYYNYTKEWKKYYNYE